VIRRCVPKTSASRKTYSKDIQDVANDFNNYFASIGKNTVEEVNRLRKELKLESTDEQGLFTPRVYSPSE